MTLIVLAFTEGMFDDERIGSVVKRWMRYRVAGKNLTSDTYCAGFH